MNVYTSVLDMIGNTPMVRLNAPWVSLENTIYLKLESANPGGSIKDRIAVNLIDVAEREGLIAPGGMLVEATAGNTGIGLAIVANQKGYSLTCVLPDKMSAEKVDQIRACGANIVLTKSDVSTEHPDHYINYARRIAEETENAFFVNQFHNMANPDAHYQTTGPEVWKQLDGKVDAFVAGVGTGGTISGAGKYLKEQDPNVDIILADPKGSILAAHINENKKVEPESFYVEGIGEDFFPVTLDLSVIDKAYTITDEEAFRVGRDVLKHNGVFAGTSSGVLVASAIQYALEHPHKKNIVTLICDTGKNYASKMYNEAWLRSNGFESILHGDDI